MSDQPTAPSAAMPDLFDYQLGQLDGISTSTRETVVQVSAPLGVGGTSKFIIRTIRHEGNDHLFVEMIGRDESFRRYFPPAVTAVFARQRDALTSKSRRKAARLGAATRKASGFTPNTSGLRRKRARR